MWLFFNKHLTPETFQTPFVFGLEKEKKKKKAVPLDLKKIALCLCDITYKYYFKETKTLQWIHICTSIYIISITILRREVDGLKCIILYENKAHSYYMQGRKWTTSYDYSFPYSARYQFGLDIFKDLWGDALLTFPDWCSFPTLVTCK